ncbi:conserved hypothetical protein [Pseudomonas jessenii]
MVTVPAPSRASPLPQGTAINCGSGLAREGARSNNAGLEGLTKNPEYHYRQFLPYCHMTDSLQL